MAPPRRRDDAHNGELPSGQWERDRVARQWHYLVALNFRLEDAPLQVRAKRCDLMLVGKVINPLATGNALGWFAFEFCITCVCGRKLMKRRAIPHFVANLKCSSGIKSV